MTISVSVTGARRGFADQVILVKESHPRLRCDAAGVERVEDGAIETDCVGGVDARLHRPFEHRHVVPC